MRRYSYLSKAVALMLGIGLSGLTFTTQAGDVEISVNQSLLSEGQTMVLSAGIDWDEAESPLVDIYISIQLVALNEHILNGTLLYMVGPAQFSSVKNRPAPILQAWPIRSLSTAPIFTFPIPEGMAGGKYKWYITAVEAGTDPAQPGNWVAHDSAEFYLDDGLPPAAPDSGNAGTSTLMDLLFGLSEDNEAEPETEDEEPEALLPGTLTAGDVDDNLNYESFLGYLQRARADKPDLPEIDLRERVTFQIRDSAGRPLSNAHVVIRKQGRNPPLLETYAATDGSLQVFPYFDRLIYSEESPSFFSLMYPFFEGPLEVEISDPAGDYTVVSSLHLDGGVDSGDESGQSGQDDESGQSGPNDESSQGTDGQTTATPSGDSRVTIVGVSAALPTELDLMFVIDTTGSMRDELDFVTTELRDISGTVAEQYPGTHIRFGLTVYRDSGDDYVVRDYPFVESLDEMQVQLGNQQARGGGDYPEAMERALSRALQADWRPANTARLLFLVADAPPHAENFPALVEQIRIARQMGVRLYSVAASGIDAGAEYLMRSASALTQARFLFLTDDSEVGNTHAQPSVACAQVTKLASLISRVIAGELGGRRMEAQAGEVLRTVGNPDKGVCRSQAAVPSNPFADLLSR